MADGSRDPDSPAVVAKGSRPRVALVALGCRVNRADLDAIAAQLASRFDLVDEGTPAEFVVVNTCSVTGDADSAARQAIRRAARANPGARIVAAGCYAEVAPGVLAAFPGVAAVVGARAQNGVPELLTRLAAGDDGETAMTRATAVAPTWAPPAIESPSHARPLLKIQDGCDAACAYCVVPRARGASRSMPFEDAVSALLALGERYQEVVLTGVHLGAYGRDLAPPRSLAALVSEAASRGLRARVRLSSVEPREFPRALLVGGLGRTVCEHFHLPLQSGSARLFRAMRRPGGPAEYRQAVEEIAALAPGACLGADVMVGFPGETEADHRETIELIEALPLAYLHVFPFSPRPGTRAAAMSGAVPGRVIRERARELRTLSERRWRAFLSVQAGRELEVVVERVEGGLARGTARQYVTVRWPSSGEQRGALEHVRVEASDGNECFGIRASTFADRLPP